MLYAVLLALLVIAGQLAVLAPVRSTAQVPNDPDDPAIWIHPSDPAKSLIFGTDKMPGKGGLYSFRLDGTLARAITPLDRPNNVDVAYGLDVGGTKTDVVVVTERLQHRLRVFGINPQTGELRDLAPQGLPVLAGQAGDAGEPMGIALYERPRDGAIFAIVSPKTGAASQYLWQYRLAGRNGRVSATLVRRFGAFSGIGPTPGSIGEIEAVVVDDELGFVYYSDERFGIRKWHADPDHPDAAKEIAVLGRDGYRGDREGLAIYRTPNGGGYLVSSDQIPGATRLVIYPRRGPAARPHEQAAIAVIPTTADSTDGLDVTQTALPGFPNGLLMMMNSTPRNFLFYDWRQVASRLDRGASK